MFHVQSKYGDDGLAKNYKFRAQLGSSIALTPDQNATTNLSHLETWGLAFVAGSTGFRVTLTAIHTPAGDSWSAQFESPWGTFTTGGVGTATSIESVIEVDQALLAIGAACSGSLAFNAARWKVGVNGAAPVAVVAATIGAQTYAIVGFDLRLNVHAVSVGYSTTTSLPNGLETCAGSAGAQASWNRQITATADHGWEWDSGSGFTEDPVTFQADPALPTPTCSCPVGLPGGSGGTLSYHLSGSAVLNDVITVTNSGSVTLVCPLGGSVTGNLWSVRRQVDNTASYVVGAVPNTFPITPLQIDVTALCGTIGSGSTLSYTTASPAGLSRLAKSRVKADGTRECFVRTSGTCNAVMPPNTNNPPIPPDIPWCGFTCTRTDSWPNLPPCSGSDAWPWNHSTPDGRFHRVDVESGDVWIYNSHFHNPPFDMPVQITTSADTIRPTVAEDFRKRLFVTYTRVAAGVPSAFYRWSDDDGDTFSVETALGFTNGKYAAVFTSSEGDVIFAAFLYNSGHSGSGKIYYRYWGSGVPWSSVPAAATIKDSSGTDIVFADDTFAFAFAFDGARRLILHGNVDGDGFTSTWESFDEAASWGNKNNQITLGHYPTIFADARGDIGVSALVYNSGPSGPGHIYSRYQTTGLHWGSVPAAAAILDSAGSPLVAMDTTFHMSSAYHGSNAIELSVILDTETKTSEWQSWDDAATFLRI